MLTAHPLTNRAAPRKSYLATPTQLVRPRGKASPVLARLAKASSAPNLPIELSLTVCVSPGKKATSRAARSASRNLADFVLAYCFEPSGLVPNDKRKRSGLLKLVDGGHRSLVMANVGDSRAVPCRNGCSIDIYSSP